MTDYTRYEPGPDREGLATLYCADCEPTLDGVPFPIWVQPRTQVTALSLANLIGAADEHEQRCHSDAVAATLITSADQLRALPVGTVLLDSAGGAWQACATAADPIATRYLGSVNLRINPYWLTTDPAAAIDAISAYGPFRVLHTPEASRD